MSEISTGVIRKALIAFGLALVLAVPHCVMAQGGKVPDILGLKGKAPAAKSGAEWSATLTPADKPGYFVLRISAKLLPDHHIFSLTDDGAATKITIKSADGFEPLESAFVADHNPEVGHDPDLERIAEKYHDHVTWSKTYRLKKGAAPDSVSISGVVSYQICNAETCRQEKYAFEVKPIVSPAAEDVAAPDQQAKKSDAAGASTRFEHLYRAGGTETVEATWTVSVAPRQARAGDEVTLTVRAELNPRWHVYPLDLKASPDGGGSLPTVIGLTELGGLVSLENSFAGPDPIVKPAENPAAEAERYYEGRVEWTRKFKIPDGATEGDVPLSGIVAWQMCNSKGLCLLPTGFEFTGKVTIAGEVVGDAVALTVSKKLKPPEAREAIDELRVGGEKATAVVDVANAPPVKPDEPPVRGQTVAKEPAPAPSQGLFAYLVVAVVAGFAALFTPCVFPMIPITVSFFQKQSEKQHHRPITMALVYCLGIMATFTGLGMLISILFGAGALTQLANNIWLNLFIAGVLIFFSLNLLGMFEIRMPSWLLTYTAGKESHGGFVGVLFMALTFTLTSFTCTFAFAGLLLVQAMNGGRLWPILGLLAFSAAFSLPFFFLALFPSMLQKLPKSGGWMNVVKVIMGLVELGAAFKYLGVADQSWNGDAAVFDFHLMISAWAVISIASAMYLMGLFRLPHDTPVDHIGVFRFVSAMSFMGLASYLAVGLFSAQKPQGVVWKYVEAYANPDFEGGSDRIGPYLEHGPMKLKYALDFERALKIAIAENKPVFLDFTGVNCSNCRWMEKGPMSQPDIEERLKQFVRVQLFTDAIPKKAVSDRSEAERLRAFNERFQAEWYGDVSLPSYVVIPPDPTILEHNDRSKILSDHAGKTDEVTFARFLDRGLDGWKKVQAQKSTTVVSKR